MKITLVHYSAPPTIGGVERVMGQQARALQAAGHEVTLLVSKGESHPDWPEVVVLPEFDTAEGLRQALEDQDWVIVHNMFTMPFDWPASRSLADLSNTLPRTRFINWVHDVDVSSEDFEALNLKALPVAVSEERRKKFLHLAKHSDSEGVVIPNGLDVKADLHLTDRVKTLLEALDLSAQELVIFHPTRVVARKNLELGLRLTRQLLDQGLKVMYLITGAPDLHRATSRLYAEQIQNLRMELKLEEAVQFLGDREELEDADIQALYRFADLVFFPSTQEGFGLPLLEAILHRVPIVCSDIPIHREVGGAMVHYFGLEDAMEEVASKCLHCLPGKDFSRKRRQMIHDLDWKQIYKSHLAPLIERVPDNGD